ncbi:hypothetical protein [Thermomonospora cellulosilytica]|uniref:DNA-directed RNA polymerase n=1 Tax=Thermomonospora cellulosilytica TaxID=1411118 RepID=A0A7W3RB62_9ACTN|nr:hypothetical protein [Thermomonospora cellulosilytica]MBA9005985.1 DNA-directed RNA polymerase [Thermomonospora cellulosilytica]
MTATSTETLETPVDQLRPNPRLVDVTNVVYVRTGPNGRLQNMSVCITRESDERVNALLDQVSVPVGADTPEDLRMGDLTKVVYIGTDRRGFMTVRTAWVRHADEPRVRELLDELRVG